MWIFSSFGPSMTTSNSRCMEFTANSNIAAATKRASPGQSNDWKTEVGLYTLFGDAGDAGIGTNKQSHQIRRVAAGKPSWAIPQLGSITKAHLGAANSDVEVDADPLESSWAQGGKQHPWRKAGPPWVATVCLDLGIILQPVKSPCPKREHFLHGVQLWYIPMQMNQFSLFLYEKSPIFSPSLNLSPRGLDKNPHWSKKGMHSAQRYV